jgi:hypothetical protein
LANIYITKQVKKVQEDVLNRLRSLEYSLCCHRKNVVSNLDETGLKLINVNIVQMKEMPPSCCNGFQATVGYNNVWHWLKVQEVTIQNMFKIYKL